MDTEITDPTVRRVLRMVPRDGMREVFYECLSDYDTKRECFEALNAEYEELIGEPRFKSYESFRVSCLSREM